MKYAIKITLVLLVVIIIATAMRWKLKKGRFTPPPAGVSVLDRKPTIAQEIPSGFVVWSSNRFGNHDILRMDLPERKIKRLTRHPHTEYHPRISPDGRHIVFARSHIPWVSQRNQAPWDVILLDLKTGNERLLAKNGNSPTWSANGKKIYFQRNLVEFIEIDIRNAKERLEYRKHKHLIS